MSVLNLLGFFEIQTRMRGVHVWRSEKYCFKKRLHWLLPADEEAMPRRVLYPATKTMQLDNNKILRANDHKFETNTGNFPRDISRNPRPDNKQSYV